MVLEVPSDHVSRWRQIGIVRPPSGKRVVGLHQCAREVDSVMAEFCKESGRTTEFRNLESPLSIRKSIVEVVSVAPVKADPELEDRIDRREELILVQAEILMNEIRHIRRAPSPHPRR